jgi:hypothetical protein
VKRVYVTRDYPQHKVVNAVLNSALEDALKQSDVINGWFVIRGQLDFYGMEKGGPEELLILQDFTSEYRSDTGATYDYNREGMQ